MSGEPDAYPVAYCAPGQRLAAELALMLKGERVARIAEHPWLEGISDVIVISEPPRFPLPPWPAPAGASPEPRDWPYRIGGIPGQPA